MDLIAAIVLAGGSSSRMGTAKQTLDVDGVPMLQRVLATLQETEVDEVVVVLGARANEVRTHVRFERQRVVVNKRFEGGMSTSIRAGLREVEGSVEAVLVVLGDQPFVTRGTVNKLIASYRRTKAPVVLPVYEGQRGNPVLFDKSLFPELNEIRGDVGAKSVVKNHDALVVEVSVDDRGVLVDIDTPEDYSRILPRR